MSSKSNIFLAILVVGMIPIGLAAQGALETGRTVARPNYPVEWPSGPSQSSAPQWARNGIIRFSRWDGGRIETAKAMLSAWARFWPPDPDTLYATTNWYDPQTIRFLREAGINMVWVTFSNGFSNQTEKLHEAQVAQYIEACHHQGIHVMAYESIANMFWQDMYKNVPESQAWPSIGKDGKPVPYGAAAYKDLGYISRYMADPGNPQWLAYLRTRVDLAINAGADGVIYDNNLSSVTKLLNVYKMIYQYGASKKPDFLLMGNFHRDTYVFNRLTNCMTTEDGWEPGIYDEARAHLGPEKQQALTVGRGVLVNNIGLFRLLDSLSEGWKLNLVEDGRREVADRLSAPMSPQRQQLALAEAMSFGVAEEPFVEDAFATSLWNNDPQAIAILSAMGKYNKFFANHEEYYAGTQSVAPIVVVLDDSSRGVGLLNGLAARNVLFDVIYERDLNESKLAHYSTVALLTAATVNNAGLASLEHYVSGGGKLLAAGDVAGLDETGAARPRPSFFGQKIGKGECTYFDQIPSADELAEILKGDQDKKIPTLNASPGIIYNVVEPAGKNGLLVHLLNYTLAPTENIRIALHGTYKSARLVSPDISNAVGLSVHKSNGDSEFIVPNLNIYSVLVLVK